MTEETQEENNQKVNAECVSLMTHIMKFIKKRYADKTYRKAESAISALLQLAVGIAFNHKAATKENLIEFVGTYYDKLETESATNQKKEA